MCVCIYVHTHTHTHKSHCTVLSDWESICIVTDAKEGKKVKKKKKHISAKFVQECETTASD